MCIHPIHHPPSGIYAPPHTGPHTEQKEKRVLFRVERVYISGHLSPWTIHYFKYSGNVLGSGRLDDFLSIHEMAFSMSSTEFGRKKVFERICARTH